MANQFSGDNIPVSWSLSGKQPHLPPRNPSFSTPGTAVPGSDNLFPSWSNIPSPIGSNERHQRMLSASCIPNCPPPWIGDLSSDTTEVFSKSSSHRRSSSDSVTFLDAPASFSKNDEIVEEDQLTCKTVTSVPAIESKYFDKLDEEQLMSMFADIEPFQKHLNQPPELPTHAATILEKRVPAMENPSTPSDHNSVNEHSFEEHTTRGMQKFKGEPEVQSARVAEHAQLQAMNGERSPSSIPRDPNLDPKRAKRILANRLSAQRSRVRKLHYISELERSVSALQNEVSSLSPQVAYLDQQRAGLNVDNSVLKQRIAALAQEKLFKDAHCDALKKEVQRLRQLYEQQQHCQQSYQQLQQDMSFDLQQQQLCGLDPIASLQVESKHS